MSLSIKTSTRAAGSAFQRLPALTLIILFIIFEGASARASEKGQPAPGELTTAPSLTAPPAQPQTEQPVPGELTTAPSPTTPPAQPQAEQPVPGELTTVPSPTTPPTQPQTEQPAPGELTTAPSPTMPPTQPAAEQPPGELTTAPSLTTPPTQPAAEQAPGELTTAPSPTTPPAQPEAGQPAPGELTTAPSLTAPPAQPEKEQKKLPAAKELRYVDMLHSAIVRRLLTSAVWLDSFFSDDVYTKEINQSYARFRYEIFKEERANVTLRPAVDLRLALPELEKKTHLVISADPAEPPAGAANAPVRTAAERFGTTAQNTITAGLQYIFHQDAQTSFIIRTGFQFIKLTPIIVLAPRFRILMPMDPWAVRFTQEVIGKTNGTLQSDTRFDFERPLPYELFFRASIDGLWDKNANGYAYSLAFALLQPLAPTHALNYEWINSYNTYPVGALTEVAFRVRYRHSYLRDWLFFELAPQVRFPRDANFDATAGILFKIEMLFGQT